MTPLVFDCTCFVQDLSPGLDKLSPRFIKCVFVGYYRTQKGYQCYNPSIRKYLVSADVIFFESVPYSQVPITISETILLSSTVLLPTSASTVSSLVSPIETQNPPATKPVRNFKYVYTHRPKVSSFEPIPANPSLVDGPPPPPSASPYDFDMFIALQKCKRSFTDYPISNFISYDHLNPTFL